MVTLKDIAALCNVSVATVSRALNGLIDADSMTAKRILKAAHDMGYLPNAAARTLKTNRSYNIGILYEDEIHHEYFSLLIDNIRKAAEKKGYDITFLHKSSNMSYYEHAKYRGLDGVVILQAAFHSPEIIQLAESDLPCVAIDYEYACCSCVVSDHFESMNALVRYAYDKGHRKIAFVHGQDGYITSQRINAFCAACAALGIKIPSDYLCAAAYHDPKAASLSTKTLLSLEERPTCIFYPDDYSCLGALTQLERAGLSVPDDITIAGFDGIMLAGVLRPKLTTYRQNVLQKGETAVSLLVEAIESTEEQRVHRLAVVAGQMQPGGTL